MKILKVCSLIFMFLIFFSCKEEDATSICGDSFPYRAKLVIKGICLNYVIELIDVGSNSNLVEAKWADEFTGKVYNNVFRLSNYCDFPPEIQEGDEFYFGVSSNSNNASCIVCQAFRPTPVKSININVCELPPTGVYD